MFSQSHFTLVPARMFSLRKKYDGDQLLLCKPVACRALLLQRVTGVEREKGRSRPLHRVAVGYFSGKLHGGMKGLLCGLRVFRKLGLEKKLQSPGGIREAGF
ncbi:MAG: hypothetical protein A3H27_19155 [Acidobacteria bacterium RIFCSPLOWO2_02_FULL_59_13]|nr:MAG: hypothetical protein A3H27_19155 [Acidobacteria bacterium RIFCSPLOWO2_02_FULL_59_13]